MDVGTYLNGVKSARLLIAEDHALVRDGLRAMLENEDDLEVAGEAENGLEALEACRSLKPDLVLMDVRMPEMDGLEATRAIKAAHPRISVLMVTTHREPDYLMEAVRAGAAGYVLKESTKRELLGAVRKVLRGESPLDQDLAMQILRRVAEKDVHGKQPPNEPLTHGGIASVVAQGLTTRETEVLVHLAAGKTNRLIADDLYISLSTVKRHVERIIKKLGVSDRTQAAVRAIELGVLFGAAGE